MLRHIGRFGAVLTITALLIMGASLLLLKQTGSRALSVQSGSMVPALHKGDLAIVKRVPSYKVGDVITFTSPKDPQTTITHRVIAVNAQNRTLQTKGDANQMADRPIAFSRVVGKVQFDVPGAGTAIDFIRQPIGLALIIYVPALAVVASELRRLATYYRHQRYLLRGRNSHVFARQRTSTAASRLGSGLAVMCLLIGVAVPVAQAALSSATQLTANTISSVKVKSSYQVCSFPSTSTLLSYALIDVFYPELPDPPIMLDEPIIPGSYKITALSQDAHTTHPNAPTQPNERWFVQMYGNTTTAPAFTSGVTDDIPDHEDQTSTVINETTTFTEPITSIRYVHNAFLTGIEKNNFGGTRTFDELSPEEKRQVIWNSVHPGCITFERLRQ